MKLKVSGIEFSYKSDKVLDDVSFEVNRGEIVAILGTNGAGKSTLLKSIAREIKVKGEIIVFDRNIYNCSYEEFGKKIGYVSQHFKAGELSVFDTLLLGRKIYFKNSPKKEDLKKVEEIIDRLNLSSIAFKKTKDLSGGEAQKVAIARAILQESEVLLVDEPTNNLDIKNQIEVLKLIKELNKTAILVMHDINLALRFCNKFLFMKDGKIKYEGGEEIISKEIIFDIYGVEIDICQWKGRKIVIVSE